MDAVSIESRFGSIYGERGRGHTADADRIRGGEPKYLAKALEKAHEMLSKRFVKLPESDRFTSGLRTPLTMWRREPARHGMCCLYKRRLQRAEGIL